MPTRRKEFIQNEHVCDNSFRNVLESGFAFRKLYSGQASEAEILGRKEALENLKLQIKRPS